MQLYRKVVPVELCREPITLHMSGEPSVRTNNADAPDPVLRLLSNALGLALQGLKLLSSHRRGLGNGPAGPLCFSS